MTQSDPLEPGAAVPRLHGTRVTLRPLQADDEAARRRWGRHAEIDLNYGFETESGPMSAEQARAWFEHQQRLATDPPGHPWLIEAGGELAGEVRLHHVSRVDAKARLAIGMFAPRFTGRGLGTEAVRLVLGHAFGELGLHRVDLRVLAFNRAAIAVYRRCGFIEEGRERDSCRIGERWHDDVIMGILDHEWRTGEAAR